MTTAPNPEHAKLPPLTEDGLVSEIKKIKATLEDHEQRIQRLEKKAGLPVGSPTA